jgi:hypothetical protein
MKKSVQILEKFIGRDGYEALHKAIYKDGSRSVLDPAEFLLPLLVVPRTILSWLVQNIRPLKIGEHKEIKIPHVKGASLWVQKQDADVYRGELTRDGKVIQTFEKQSLPTVGATIMSAGEQYDHLLEDKKDETCEPTDKLIDEHERLVGVLKSPSHEDDKKEAKVQEKELKEMKVKDIKEESSEPVIRQIMALDPDSAAPDAEQIKWITSHANIKELTGVIGKLVDALVAQKIGSESMGKKEMQGDKQKVEAAESPKETATKNQSAKKAVPAIDNKEGQASPFQTSKETKNLATDNGPPKCEEVKAGKEAAAGKIEKDEMGKPPIPQKPRPEATPAGRSLRGLMVRIGENEKAKDMARESIAAQQAAPKPPAQPIKKQDIGMGAAVKVEPAPSASAPKTHKLPEPLKKPAEKVSKAGEMPGGRGAPKGPSMPQPPKPPVGPSHAPAAAAAKQSQAAMKGQQSAPKLPASVGIKAPGATAAGPKAPAMAAKPPMAAPKSMAAPKLAPPKMPAMKSEIIVTKSEIMSNCQHCQQPEFKMVNGNPEFSPCACFRVLRKDESGQDAEFVKILKKNDGTYGLQFSKNADPDAVKAFLLALKAKLLIGKKYGII